MATLIPPILPGCIFTGVLSLEGKPLLDEAGNQILVDLSGGDNEIRWNPNMRIQHSFNKTWVELGRESFSLRVWKRKHGPLNINTENGSCAEPSYIDPWAKWLDENLDASFLIAGVEFKIESAIYSKNGTDYWLQGRRVENE